MDHYPLKSKFFSEKILIQKLWKILGILWKYHFLMPSAILKKCAVDVFRSAHQYLRSADWSFNLEELSDKSELCTDLSEAHTDRYQRSVEFW